RRLLPRPFSRGEGWGEGLPGVVYSAVLAVPVAIVTLFPASQAIAREKAGGATKCESATLGTPAD
ncbi:MAG: hypothetical protein WCQ21_27760, partial [Verrucomicrobiota bacterium]